MLGVFKRNINRLIAFKREDESWIKFAGRVRRKLRTRSFSKKEVGREELKQLKSVIKSGNLFHGPKVEQFRNEFAKLYGVRYAITSTSGTAAIHVALAVINPDPGDEIITTPITDMGTIIPIIYQNAIPVFADIHPDTWTIDPKSLEKAITPKTKGIIAVHIFGGVCDMDAILDVAKKHNIPVIEDCAQAHFAEYKHQLVGTIGDIGCFSLQQSKQIITGEGGMTITNNSEYGDRGTLFVDKGWNRPVPGARQYIMPGMNYRMTELQAAVGIAQLRKLKSITERRNRNGNLLTEQLMKVDGITPQYVGEGDKHTYLFVAFTVNPDAPFTADVLARTLSEQGVSVSAHYTGKPIYLCSEPLMKKQFYGNSHFPFDHPNARQDITYEPGMCPVAEDVLNRLVLLNTTERYSEKDVRNVANEVTQAVSKLSRNINNPGWSPPNKSKQKATENEVGQTISNSPQNSLYRESSNDSKYKVGIIGCGEISRYHAEAYQANSDVAVTAIADINPDAFKTIASQFSISNCYTDYHEMLANEQLDIISICTWPGLHAEMTVAAAERGVKAIFCEKPMAVNLGEADSMINACQQSGAKLVISHQLRFNPHITKAKELIESGVIGEPSLVWGHYKGCLLNMGTHVVDAMRYILGDPKTDWVLGQIERKKDSYNRGHRIEEIAEALIQFSNGTRGLLETGDLAISEFGCHIYGSEGQLDVALNKLLLQSKDQKGWQQIQLPAVKEHGPAVAELIACLNGEVEQHRNNVHQARMTLEILMAIFESVRTHGVVCPPVTISESPLDVMVESGIL